MLLPPSHLRRCYAESDVHHTTWAARTLLEIRMFAEYITSSSENMRRFYQDLYVDGEHALDVASKVLDKIPDDPTTPVAREFLEQAIPLVQTRSEAADASELEAYPVRADRCLRGPEAAVRAGSLRLGSTAHR